MWIIYTREIKQLFYQWAYCASMFVLNWKIERALCYSGSNPSLTSQLLQDALTTSDFLVIGSKIKCYACAQDLSSQLQINWSKTRFDLIFLCIMGDHWDWTFQGRNGCAGFWIKPFLVIRISYNVLYTIIQSYFFLLPLGEGTRTVTLIWFWYIWMKMFTFSEIFFRED